VTAEELLALMAENPNPPPIESRFVNVTRRLPKRTSGVYILTEDGISVYIGTSSRLKQRIYEHHCTSKKFDEVWFLKEENRNERYAVEAMLIAKHNPIYNRNPAAVQMKRKPSPPKLLKPAMSQDLIVDFPPMYAFSERHTEPFRRRV
jgi:hypothetical protein